MLPPARDVLARRRHAGSALSAQHLPRPSVGGRAAAAAATWRNDNTKLQISRAQLLQVGELHNIIVIGAGGNIIDVIRGTKFLFIA